MQLQFYKTSRNEWSFSSKKIYGIKMFFFPKVKRDVLKVATPILAYAMCQTLFQFSLKTERKSKYRMKNHKQIEIVTIFLVFSITWQPSQNCEREINKPNGKCLKIVDLMHFES